MPRKSSGELKALLAAERYNALSAMAASKLSDERATALNYYLGDMSKDMPAPAGRSKAVSSDVADTVEGLLPPLMEVFAGGDEVVKFDPVGPMDVAAAEQETDYVNHVFMQANPGFLVLYSFIKDALLSKVGVVKVVWEARDEIERETYFDLDDAAFALISADPDVEVVEHSARPMGMDQTPAGIPGGPGSGAIVPPGPQGAQAPPQLHDVTVETKHRLERAEVLPVPPEEFGISRRARSIRDTDYCFHDVFRTQSKLIELGYDREQVNKLPSYTLAHTIEEIARDTVNESTLRQGDDSLNDAARLIRVTEHYVRMDYEGDGEAALYRVTTAGEEGELLTRDGEPDIHREDIIPFAAMTPVIITHRFFGRSVADLIVDIQRIKTALLRALMDNAYLANNPRIEVSDAHANDATLDDLLVSRPGGLVRTKMPGGLNVLQHPDIGNQVFPLLQYQDTIREWRTGVSRQGQGVDPNALQNQVATIANQLFNASQAKVKLIARIFAETGIRDLFQLLHAVIRKHSSKPQTVQLRKQWVTVDPREWKKRDAMTINVGLGTGSKAEQLAHMQMIAALQEKVLPLGLVTPQNAYETLKETSKLAGHMDADRFFAKPNPQTAQQPIPPPPDPKQTEIQAKTAAEQEKLKADAAHQQMRMNLEMQLEQQKFELQKELALLEARIKAEQHASQLHADLAKAVAAGAPTGPDGQPLPHPMLGPILALHAEMKKANAPRRLVRDPHTGKPVGSEVVMGA
jgi:hypothetical protein